MLLTERHPKSVERDNDDEAVEKAIADDSNFDESSASMQDQDSIADDVTQVEEAAKDDTEDDAVEKAVLTEKLIFLSLPWCMIVSAVSENWFESLFCIKQFVFMTENNILRKI